MEPQKNLPAISTIFSVPVSEIYEHPQNPFGVRDDSAMRELVDSVKTHGVLVPAIVRPRVEGGYELISGHRRKHSCEAAGIDTMPVLILNMSDDEAVIQLVDSNIQRDDVLPSEKAHAYRLKLEAMKRQGKRTDLVDPESVGYRSDDAIGEQGTVSGDTIRNYVSLTNLIPELLQLVDEKRIALSPAYQLSHLKKKEQIALLDSIESEQVTPSLSQAQRMKKLSQSDSLTEEAILAIMMEQKKQIKRDITLSGEKLRKYFPKSYSSAQIETIIFKLLEVWQRKRQRDANR